MRVLLGHKHLIQPKVIRIMANKYANYGGLVEQECGFLESVGTKEDSIKSFISHRRSGLCLKQCVEKSQSVDKNFSDFRLFYGNNLDNHSFNGEFYGR